MLQIHPREKLNLPTELLELEEGLPISNNLQMCVLETLNFFN
jgi:hypothetical protein